LIIDDSKTTIKTISRQLQNSNYHVESATNSEDALKLMKKRTYDLVLLDLNLPIVSGLEIVKIFREFEYRGGCIQFQKIIGMSSSYSLLNLKEIGFDAFLLKPFSVANMENLETVQLVLQSNLQFKPNQFLQVPSNILITKQPKVNSKTESIDILVVDDSPLVRKCISQMLIKAGHRVETLSSGREALDVLDLQKFDLVLLDINMPDLNGLETAMELKLRQEMSNFSDDDDDDDDNEEENRCQYIKHKIALMTSELTDIKRTELNNCGLQYCLLKPFTMQKFNDLLEGINFE
jgi:CheY-like chemotaxis protein